MNLYYQQIHMNGRVYDYNLGRFLSVDPFIQAPGNSQSLNPYSYIMNNPLSGTDPTGYASVTEEKKIRENVTGSHIKRVTGTQRTTKITDDKTGAVTSQTVEVIKNDGTFLVNSVSSNGQQATVTSINGNYKAGIGGNSTVNIMSQGEIAQKQSDSGFKANSNWCYQGACRTGLEFSLDGRSAKQVDQGLEDLNSYMSMATGMLSLPSLIRSFSIKATKSADEIFQFGDDVVRQMAVQQYQGGFKHLRQFMSPREIKAYLADPENGSRFLGHAVHRATESALQKLHPGRFDYNATRAFDFLDKSTGQAIELTTKKGLKTHQNRGADLVTYN
jgi:RHS repeat-associated protein